MSFSVTVIQFISSGRFRANPIAQDIDNKTAVSVIHASHNGVCVRNWCVNSLLLIFLIFLLIINFCVSLVWLVRSGLLAVAASWFSHARARPGVGNAGLFALMIFTLLMGSANASMIPGHAGSSSVV